MAIIAGNMAELTGSAKRVTEDYDAWSKYSQPYRNKWFKYWKQWNNKRINRQYKAKVADSIDPMAHQMIEARVDNIYGSRPRPAYIPTQPEQEKDTKLLTGMFQYSWNKSEMDAEIIPVGREIEMTGNTIIFTGWADGYMTMTPIPIADCIGDTAASKPSQVKKIGYRRLAILEDLRNEMEFDPSAGEKDEDGNTKGAWVKKYKIPRKIDTWSGMDDLDKKKKEEIYGGSTLPDDQKDKQGEVIRMHYLDKTIEVLNRKYVIYEKANLFQADEREVDVQEHSPDAEPMYDEQSLPEWAHNMSPEELAANKDRLASELAPAPKKIKAPAIAPFLPFAMGRNFVDGSMLLAKGTMETISEAVEDLQDEINIKKDNLITRQQNNALVDKDQPKLIPLLAKARAGDLIPAEGIAEGKVPVHQLEKPELGTDTDIEIGRIKQSIRDTARVAEMVQGIESTQKKTAAEVNAQVGGASAGFKTQNKNLEAGLYKMLADQFYKMVQIFMTREQIVRVMGPDGVEFKKFDPNKYFGEYDCVVSLEEEAKAAESAIAERALKGFELFRGDPDFNQIELKKSVARVVLDKDDEELKLLMNSDPTNGATQGGAPTGDVADGAGAPGGAAPIQPPSATAVQGPGGQLHESADLVKLFALTGGMPQVQTQILQALGFDAGDQPSLDAQSKAQDLAHKEANLTMQADKHTKEMATPVQPPKVAA